MDPLQTSAKPDDLSDPAGVRAALERAARRFHEFRHGEGSSEHKWWKFEQCPADACKEARAALAKAAG